MDRMHRERQQHVVKKRCAPRLLGRACLPAIKVTAAEGFFFFGLFRPTRSRLIFKQQQRGGERSVRHVFKDTGRVFWENRVRRCQDLRSRAFPSVSIAETRRSVFVSSRNSADTNADVRTLSVRLEETSRKTDSL